MISEVVMPQMGADMTEGTLLRWLKREGDPVNRGDVIAEIETDKANVEIEAFESGVFRLAIAHEGDVVQVGETIAIIAGADDDIARYRSNGPLTGEGGGGAVKTQPPEADRAATPPSATETQPAEAAAPEPAPTTATAQRAPVRVAPADEADGRVRASPLARRLAAERGIDLTIIEGTGPGGRITRRDVDAAVTSPGVAAATQAPETARHERPRAVPAAEGVIVQPSRMRQAIARRMSQSKREAPHYYITTRIDMTEALAFRKQVNEAVEEAQRVSMNDLIVRASVLALRAHPQFNATIEGETVTQHARQHVCIGIALDEGLIAPAIPDTGEMTLVQIARAAKDLIERARNGRLRAEEMSLGTFTISNLGAYGVETLIAIIQPPQTAILGVGAAAPEPVVREGQVIVRDMMNVALSADHRVTDGAQGAQFLAEIKRLLERPLLLVI